VALHYLSAWWCVDIDAECHRVVCVIERNHEVSKEDIAQDVLACLDLSQCKVTRAFCCVRCEHVCTRRESELVVVKLKGKRGERVKIF